MQSMNIGPRTGRNLYATPYARLEKERIHVVWIDAILDKTRKRIVKKQ